MEIKKRPQRASFVPKGNHPNKCPTCNSWMKKVHYTSKEKICLTCHYREQAAAEAKYKQENPTAPPKPKTKIGTL